MKISVKEIKNFVVIKEDYISSKGTKSYNLKIIRKKKIQSIKDYEDSLVVTLKNKNQHFIYDVVFMTDSYREALLITKLN
jgi:hypothetical protein